MSFEVQPTWLKSFGETPEFPLSINIQSAAYYLTDGWIGRNTFLKLLRSYEILDDNNYPKQEYLDANHFEGHWNQYKGKKGQQFSPRVTRSGMELIKTLIPEHELVPFEIIDNE
jgi:phage antirepressor YoqD-like protein